MNQKKDGKKPTVFSWRFATIILAIFFIDLVIKQIVQRNRISTNNGFFDITYVTNTGTMWSLFANAHYANVMFIILSFLALGFLYYYVRSEQTHQLPISLIAAGILGNLFDRIVFGYVIDWANFHFWPIFNIADASLVCGVIWLATLIIKEEVKKKPL